MAARYTNGSFSATGEGNDSVPNFAATAQMAQLLELGAGDLGLLGLVRLVVWQQCD